MSLHSHRKSLYVSQKENLINHDATEILTLFTRCCHFVLISQQYLSMGINGKVLLSQSSKYQNQNFFYNNNLALFTKVKSLAYSYTCLIRHLWSDPTGSTSRCACRMCQMWTSRWQKWSWLRSSMHHWSYSHLTLKHNRWAKKYTNNKYLKKQFSVYKNV